MQVVDWLTRCCTLAMVELTGWPGTVEDSIVRASVKVATLGH